MNLGVRVIRKWKSPNIYLGVNPLPYTWAGPEEGPSSDLVNKYALVTFTKGDSNYDVVKSVQPVESHLGTLSSFSAQSITVDGKSYFIDTAIATVPYDLEEGKEILYHLDPDKKTVVGISTLTMDTGVLKEWDRNAWIVVIDKTSYPVNSVSDLTGIDDLINQKVDFLVGKDLMVMRVTERSATSGTCGAKATWKVEDNTLIIDGSGRMNGYNAGQAPWMHLLNDIKKVVIGPQITYIGTNFNYEFSDFIPFYFEGDLPEFGENAFAGRERVVFYPDNSTWTDQAIEMLSQQFHNVIWQKEGLAGPTPRIQLKDTWSFENFAKSTPDECYGLLYKPAQAEKLRMKRAIFGNPGDGGNCYGMAVAAGNVYFGNPGVNTFHFDEDGISDYKSVWDISRFAVSSEIGLSAEMLIQTAHLFQFSDKLSRERFLNIATTGSYNFSSLVRAVNNYLVNNGDPVQIFMDGFGLGHTVLALSMKDHPDRTVIGVYDSNYPGVLRYLYLNKIGSVYTGWEYEFSSEETWKSSPTTWITHTVAPALSLQNKGRQVTVSESILLSVKDGTELKINSAHGSASAKGYDTSNAELLVPVGDTANSSGQATAGNSSRLYWADMGNTLEFQDVPANAELELATGYNGIDVNKSATSNITIQVSELQPDKHVVVSFAGSSDKNDVSLSFTSTNADRKL